MPKNNKPQKCRYCGNTYPAGWYSDHVKSKAHREKMEDARWYREHGYGRKK